MSTETTTRTKTCTQCERVLPVAEFAVMRAARDGLQRRCNECNRANVREYATANPHKQWERAYRHRVRAIHPNRPVILEHFTKAEVVARQGGEHCSICGAFGREQHLDHITPVSHGGAHTLENVRLLCAECNESRGLLEKEWLRRNSSKLSAVAEVAA